MSKTTLPEGFCLLKQEIPTLLIDLKYSGNDNLLGRPLAGYSPDASAVLTHEAAASIAKMQAHLQKPTICRELNFTQPRILILDAYRPQMGSDDFWEWSQTACEKTKENYYPNLNKRDFFKLGYIGRKSSHSRGSTIDLNIIDVANGKNTPLDMGTAFDFMDPLSHPDNRDVTEKAYQNRQFLKKLMNDFGWVGIEQEWWHFTYSHEPFVDTYFNFPLINYEE